ncbi:DNA polymerase alpha/epsilon subunit B-domain-containing protein [Umbelopsis sp. PMI_123]|nr:DNA polymerase alpha/epsilon subunit B-domain-containing protein [Umbelopsis sp. PMI_123]
MNAEENGHDQEGNEPLLSIPSDQDFTVPDEIRRKTAEYYTLPDSENPFIVKEQTFRQQYANLYFIRLTKLRTAALEAARERWSGLPEKTVYVPKVLDVQAGKLCYIIGTVYMDMPLKPNILEDITKENYIVSQPPPPKYASSDAIVAMEDESGRVVLCGSRLQSENLVTGTIIAALGHENAFGEFEVVDICTPGLPDPNPTPRMDIDTPDNKYVALLSGLNCGSDGDSSFRLEMLLEYLTGELGDSQDAQASQSIVKVILAGNSVTERKIIVDDKKPKKYGYDSTIYDASPITALDKFLQQLCSSVSVDIMPGRNDPANAHLPQQPLHHSLFTTAHKLSSLKPVTNPHWCEMDGVSFLGTSGQTIDDLDRYTEGCERLQLAEFTMSWRHIAPSAPDTLWCYPFQDRDPFLIEQCPDVYFIGNQPSFDTSELVGSKGQRVRVITIPSFSETGCLVLVNLSSLKCKLVSICPPNSSS